MRELIRYMVIQKEKKFVAKGKIPNNDMVDHLLKYLSDNPESDFCDLQGICDDMISFFVAGTDSTARTAQVAIYFLTQNPDILAKVK